MSLRNQLKNNQLAIISLIVAFTALGYNTWRNELTEQNRNYRQAGFEILVHLSELRKITYLAHYDKDTVGGNPRKGWAEVLVIQDLATLMPDDMPLRVTELQSTWAKHWDKLGKDVASANAIDTSLDDVRSDVLAALQDLD